MTKIDILIIQTHPDGGANLLLNRVSDWLIKNGYYTETRIISRDNIPNHNHFQLAILPCYVMYDVYYLKKKKISIDRVLLWDMGMGCFQDGYYNPYNNTGIKGLITKLISKEAEKALIQASKLRSLCFTDIVGRLNTYKSDEYANEEYCNHDLIPIGVDIPPFRQSCSDRTTIHACWVGRVSMDFKYIPLSHVLRELNEIQKAKRLNIHFTIVGNGDALDQIKKETDTLEYKVNYIDSIAYDQLDSFFKEVDLTFAMGTSALDAARNSCASVVLTPVRYNLDEEKCFYRWIYESKGYSLGEYPGWDDRTNQVKKSLQEILDEYIKDEDQYVKCYDYSRLFSEDLAFKRIFDRGLPDKIDIQFSKRIRVFYYLKKIISLYLKFKNFR